METKLPCLGFRYNFKKGSEYCPNKDNCGAHKMIADEAEGNDYLYPKVKAFATIKEFRNCKDYQNGN